MVPGWTKCIEKLDPLDRALTKDFKVGYQTGKGKHLVSVFFPKDTHKALRKLTDVALRAKVGIPEGNKYLFPSINGLMDHVSATLSPDCMQ